MENFSILKSLGIVMSNTPVNNDARDNNNEWKRIQKQRREKSLLRSKNKKPILTEVVIHKQ